MRPNAEERLDRELEAGRLWRAKEILSNWNAQRYELALCLRYAELLERLGDAMEAGKYLWLGGVVDHDCVRLFLRRMRKSNANALMMQMPSAARWLPLDAYPAAVRSELEQRRYRGRAQPRPKREWADTVAAVIGVPFLLLVLYCAFIGFRQLTGW